MKPDQSDGYSLLELLVVMAIVALITSSIMPSASRREPLLTSNDVVRRLGDVFSAARAQALTSRETVTVRLVFEPAVMVLVDDSTVIDGIPPGLKIHAVSAKTRSGNESQTSYDFLPEGGSTGGTITVDSGSDQSTISLDWLTGNWTSTQGNSK